MVNKNCIRTDSTLYKAMENLNFTPTEISQVSDKIEQEEFSKWYGNGERDSFGKPRLSQDLYISNDNGETITLNDLLNDKFYEKRQNYSKDLTYLDNIKTFLANNKVDLETRLKAFPDTEYSKNIEKLLQLLDAIQENDYISALEMNAENILRTIGNIELRFYQYDSLKDSKDKRKEDDFKKFLLHSKTFLESFTKVKNLTLPHNNEIKAYEVIKKLKDIEQEATNLLTRINKEIEANFRNVFQPLLSNPDIKNGVIDFLAAQSDENKIQLFLDSLGDSHVHFNAAVDKLFKRTMYEKDIEQAQLINQWRDKTSSSTFSQDVKRILEYENGKETGRLLQKYSREYYDNLFSYTNKIKDLRDQGKERTKEFDNLLTEYFNWKKNNTEQLFNKEYYETLNSLHPKARQAREEIEDKKKKILLKGSNNLDTDDFDEIQELNKQMIQLKSSVYPNGEKKTGEDLEISNSLTKYSRRLSEFYEYIDTNEKGFKKAEKEAKAKGDFYHQAWLEDNTSERLTDNFEKFLNNLLSELPRTDQLRDLENKANQLVKNYRDDSNAIEVDNLPENIRKEYESLVQRKKILKESLNSSIDLVKRKEIFEEFNKHIHFVSSNHYNRTIAKKKKHIEELESKVNLSSKGYILKGDLQKELDKSKQEFNEWYDENHIKNPYTGFETPKDIWTIMRPKNPKFLQRLPNSKWRVSTIKNEYLNPNYQLDNNGYPVPTSKWINKEYLNLDSKNKELLEYIRETLLYLTEHTKGDIIKQGYLPALAKDLEKSDLGDDIVNSKYITESKDIVRLIPFRYVKRVNQAAIKKIPVEATEEEAKRIEKENDEIRKQNREGHGAAIDYDIAKTIESFIKIALTNKYKSKIELDLKLAKEQIKSLNVIKSNSKGNIFDKLRSEITGKNVPYEVSAIGSNFQQHFEQWLEAVYYEDWETSDKDNIFVKGSKSLQNITSLRNIAFNPISALNNSLVGNIQDRLEAAGGVYFSGKDYRFASKNYFGNVTSYFANHNKIKSDNRVDAFIKHFDIIVSQDELTNKPDGLAKTIAYKAKALMDVGYFMQHIGEHQIQNTTLLAMSNSHRIVNGKILSFNEFYESKKLSLEPNLDESSKNLEINYKIRESTRQEFEKYPTIFDSYTLKDGLLAFNQDTRVDKDEVFNFRERIIGINQRLHGIYNTEDAALIQRHVIGRLAMQFRKYMRPAWNRRFGRRFGEKHYNEKIRDYEEGIYVTTFKFLADPFIKNYKEYKKEEEKTAKKAFVVILNGMKELFSDARLRWGVMTELEKANVKRSALEFGFLIGVFLLAIALKGMKGEDDDDKYALTVALHQCNRLIGELSTFSPIGVVKEGNRLFSSPLPILKTIEDIYKLGKSIVLYPFQDDKDREFETGIYHGKSKVQIYTEQVFPITKQYVNLKYMQERDSKFR